MQNWCNCIVCKHRPSCFTPLALCPKRTDSASAWDRYQDVINRLVSTTSPAVPVWVEIISDTATCQIITILGIETYGAYGPRGIKLVKQIGKKIQATGEKLSTFYLFQRISIAIQRGNAQCIQGFVKDRSSGLEDLFNFHVQKAEELW